MGECFKLLQTRIIFTVGLYFSRFVKPTRTTASFFFEMPAVARRSESRQERRSPKVRPAQILFEMMAVRQNIGNNLKINRQREVPYAHAHKGRAVPDSPA